MTNPSLTNFLSNYPIWPTAPPIPLKSASSDSNVQPDLPEVPETSPGAGTAPSFKRGRGRPPKAQKKRLIRAKARTRKKETPRNVETETAIQAETEAPRTAETLTEASATALRYQLRSKRQPRYKCGTCGLRDCVCLLAVNENRRVPIGARGVPPEEIENLVYRLTVRAEKTYSAVERSGDHPVDTILEKLSLPGVAKAILGLRSGLAMERAWSLPCPRCCPLCPAILRLSHSILKGNLCRWPDASLPTCYAISMESRWNQEGYTARLLTGGCW